MIGHGCLAAVQPSPPKIADIAADFLSREHAKDSADGKVTGSIAARCTRFNPKKSFLARESPDFVSNRPLAYILLIWIRNKNAAFPCDPLAHWLCRETPVLFAVIRRFATIDHDFKIGPYVNGFIVHAPLQA